MSTAEELQEEIEKVKEPFDKKVAATMAILAAALAVVSVLGHIMTTEELLEQQKASDQWSYLVQVKFAFTCLGCWVRVSTALPVMVYVSPC